MFHSEADADASALVDELGELADLQSRSKRKHKSIMRITKNDLQVVAPYLCERRSKKKKE